MTLVLYRTVDRVRDGYRSRCPGLGLAAHGYSPEAADKNLERVVRLFLAPFQREGTLQDELAAVGLAAPEGLEATRIVFEGHGIVQQESGQ